MLDQTEVRLSPETKIASGVDSYVYRIGPYVYKTYASLSLQEVVGYQILTNRAAELLSPDKPFRDAVLVNGESFMLAYTVVPVNLVIMHRSGLPMAVSRFVPGPNMVTLRPEVPAEVRQKAIAEVDDPQQTEDLEWLAESFSLDDNLESNLRNSYYEVGSFLKETLGTWGTYIIDANLKPRVNRTATMIDFKITDIGAKISNINGLHKALSSDG